MLSYVIICYHIYMRMHVYLCMHTQAIEEVAQCLGTAVSGRFFMFHLCRGNEPMKLLESQPLVQSACLLASKAFHLLPFPRLELLKMAEQKHAGMVRKT